MYVKVFKHCEKQDDEPMKFRIAIDPAGRAPDIVLLNSPESKDG